ncbi:helix-turn-helix domain-containing protein [Paenibacillus apiarius]|uniref:Helix-turn-helix domain-containing protein n=1 Tax=Paenibacillus apiarius TaxID=46240 RepID=A0ABT4DNR7_9BACL|nr:helix-turn-helix domain-containing protein [Paenibacillus apiarius]MCY9512849.1 helix-turn-helix domain-containing protein [Paenibacillus apiarius]MCY9519007.1 helix-turn-helix domain-containing protein [Paenibacillus apiarius]MCY9550816.1 helix-turn-helix domain-containing protein [Paenibacillus apiarius]MCY9559750.1 helix-turn-helix domain-containing protein [Paenibacillus apiarius]MCY9681993.1 helix-turn-helix domain-containing protein [Paenibacillus apiarius]
MMKKLSISNNHGWDENSLEKLAASLDDVQLANRVRAIRLIMSGAFAKEAAAQLGIHRQSVSGYVKEFNEGGMEQLIARRLAPGKARYLSPEQERELIRRIVSTPSPSAHGASLWSMRDIRALLQSEFHLEMSRTGIRDMLRRLGLKYTKHGYTLEKTEKESNSRPI